jgi:hypothetical protein
MSAPSTTATVWQWPPEVIEFAAQYQVDSCLDPLLAAIREVFPTATSVRVFLEDDPELRDVKYLVFEVCVPADDVADYVAAKRLWQRELSRICPQPMTCPIVLTLLPTAP